MNSSTRVQSLKVHMIAALDLQEAVDAILMAEMCGPKTSRVADLLTNYAVIAYSRPFSPGRSGTRVSRRFERFQESDFQALHREVIHMRNKVVGHNDGEYFSIDFVKPVDVVMAITPDGGSSARAERRKIDHVVKRASFDRHQLSRFKSLCIWQKSRIEAFIAEERRAVRDTLPLVTPLESLTNIGLKFKPCTDDEIPKV